VIHTTRTFYPGIVLNSNMRLLIVTQTLDPDDSTLGFFVEWIKSFAQHVTAIEVISLKKGVFNLPANVRVHSLGKEIKPASSWVYAWRFLKLAWQLRHNYDAVFVHMNPEYVVVAGWLWRLLRKRTVLWYVHRSVNVRLRIAVIFAHAVATASVESFRLSTRKVRVLGHGISLSHSPSRSPEIGRLRILTIGRISPTKRVLEMLQAVKLLHERGFPVEFSVVGGFSTQQEYEYQQILTAYVQDSGLRDVVHFRGSVPHQQIATVLADADVFLNLSATGSLDKAVLEAIAMGVAPVTSNEAFKTLLSPYGLYVASNDPVTISEVIPKAPEKDLQTLQKSVARDYALENLIPRLVKVLSRT
jgi:glycosyltransferase involved in cell wall biosynthesis